MRAFWTLASLGFATMAFAQSITLTWQDNSDNEDGFAIERAEIFPTDMEWLQDLETGAFSEVARAEANVETWTDTEVEVGVWYAYRVRAFNLYGYSGYSNVAAGTPRGKAPNAPSNALARSVDEDGRQWELYRDADGQWMQREVE